MSEEIQPVYRVIRGCIKMPRSAQSKHIAGRQDFINQGDLVPQGMLSEKEINGLLEQGIIESAGVSPELVSEAARIRERNPFCVDPSILVGKTLEDLKIMVFEIDENYDLDLLEDERAAVHLLTSGWDPKFAQTIAPVNDRSRPAALALSKLEQAGDGRCTSSSQSEMSAEAQKNLAAARAKANAPSEDSKE